MPHLVCTKRKICGNTGEDVALHCCHILAFSWQFQVIYKSQVIQKLDMVTLIKKWSCPLHRSEEILTLWKGYQIELSLRFRKYFGQFAFSKHLVDLPRCVLACIVTKIPGNTDLVFLLSLSLSISSISIFPPPATRL
jgi:hypothetical protein